MSARSLWEILEGLSSLCHEQEESIRLNLKLSPSEYRALRLMRAGEVISCQDFARRLRLSPSRGSRVVDRMVERGFLVRSDCDSDRRCKSLMLTPRGLSLQKKICETLEKRETALFGTYSRSRMTALKKELGGLAASFSRD